MPSFVVSLLLRSLVIALLAIVPPAGRRAIEIRFGLTYRSPLPYRDTGARLTLATTACGAMRRPGAPSCASTASAPSATGWAGYVQIGPCACTVRRDSLRAQQHTPHCITQFCTAINNRCTNCMCSGTTLSCTSTTGVPYVHAGRHTAYMLLGRRRHQSAPSLMLMLSLRAPASNCFCGFVSLIGPCPSPAQVLLQRQHGRADGVQRHGPGLRHGMQQLQQQHLPRRGRGLRSGPVQRTNICFNYRP
jgi:hypothetical protein